MQDIAYYNGTIGRIDEVQAPITDRGFYFGDGVYDAAMVRNRKIFALSDHLDRFYNSLKLVRIPAPLPREELAALLLDLVSRLDSDRDHMLYWQTTRGAAHRMHAFPPNAKPSLMVFSERCGMDRPDAPMHAITLEDTRFLHCNVKTLNLLPNVMAMQQATEAGCQEVVFHRGDRVTEGAHSGLAILRDGAFWTPPADELILPSITRLHMLQNCDTLGVPIRIAPFTVEELLTADEILVLSTGAHCISIDQVDGKPVGGKAPALLHSLQQAYRQRFEAEVGV